VTVILVGQQANKEVSAPEPSPWWDAVPETVARLMEMGAFIKDELLSGLGLKWDASVNLMWPGTYGAWDPRVAAARARHVQTLDFDAFVLCGRNVQRVFGVNSPICAGQKRDNKWYYCCPHSSGRNRWWNEPANRELAARMCAHITREHYVRS